MNGSSASAGWVGSQADNARTSSALTRSGCVAAPRSMFSSRIFTVYGSRSSPRAPEAASGKYS